MPERSGEGRHGKITSRRAESTTHGSRDCPYTPAREATIAEGRPHPQCGESPPICGWRGASRRFASPSYPMSRRSRAVVPVLVGATACLVRPPQRPSPGRAITVFTTQAFMSNTRVGPAWRLAARARPAQREPCPYTDNRHRIQERAARPTALAWAATSIASSSGGSVVGPWRRARARSRSQSARTGFFGNSDPWR